MKGQNGMTAVADPMTLRGLMQGQIPSEVGDFSSPAVAAPSVSNPGLTATADPKDPLTLFNTSLLEMLKHAQEAGGNVDLFKQQRGLQRAAIERTAAPTPEELRVLSPSQQSAVRSGNVNALEPEIDAVAAEIKARDSRLANFEKVLGTMKDLGQDFVKNLAPSKEIIEGYRFMIRAGANPTSIPDEVRSKVMGSMTPDDWSAWKDSNKKTSSGTDSGKIRDDERAYQSQFQGLAEVKDYKDILSKKILFDSIINSRLGGPGDLALVYQFMKGLDPNSVVRESEFDSAAKSGNIFQGIFARFNGYLKENGGFLPDNVKKSFQQMVAQSLASKKAVYDRSAQEYRTIAERQGLNPDNVVINYTGVDPAGSTTEKVLMISPQGKKGYVPADKVESAKAKGYQLAQ